MIKFAMIGNCCKNLQICYFRQPVMLATAILQENRMQQHPAFSLFISNLESGNGEKSGNSGVE